MRGQVPGTRCNGARTNSAINNTQVSSYIRAGREWRAVLSSPGAKGGRYRRNTTKPLAGVTQIDTVILRDVSCSTRSDKIYFRV